MIPTVILERVPVAGGELVLAQHGEDFTIRVRGVELMNSRNHSSEDELGRLTCARISTIAAPRVLIGGLGLGYTLRAALDALPAAATVEVVEIVPAVVRWNREILGQLASHPLGDPRVTVSEADVVAVIRQSAARYDAILLDVDNGPDHLFDGNAALYTRAGLERARTALVPGGVLAVWSSFESPTFTRWLRSLDFAVELETIRFKPRRARHYIWFARRP